MALVQPAVPRPRYSVARVDHERATDRSAVIHLLAAYMHWAGEPGTAEDRYGWLYRGNPHGQAVTLLAREVTGGSAVGMTCLFPRRVLVGGVESTGAIGGDAFVFPELRGQGIATALHRAAMNAMEDGAVDFMYGPPEPDNLRALQRAGAEITGSVCRYVRPLAVSGAPMLRRTPALVRGLAGCALRPPWTAMRVHALGPWPDPRVDEAWDAICAREPLRRMVLPVRDSHYVAWRYGRSPSGRQRALLLSSSRGRPIGLASIERVGDRMALVDFLVARGYRTRALLAVLRGQSGASVVDFQVHGGSRRMLVALRSAGFTPRYEKAFQVQVPRRSRERAQLLDRTAWHYTRGDGDVDHVL